MTITRDEYIKNSTELHHAYYLQFATSASYEFIKNNIGIKKLLSSKDEHLNDLYKISNGGLGGWIWDSTPCNIELMRELGDVNANSMSNHTCAGKAVARELIKAHKAESDN